MRCGNARVPLLGWAGPETVCHCLEQAVRRGPKRTGARTSAQIRAVWERPRFSRWPRRRWAVPASAAPTPAGPVWHAHGCPRGSDIRRLVCPCFVVRRHGLQPAVSDYGCPASSKGNRADAGAICRRARAIEYYPGRKDRQTAPRRLVRLERKSWLRDGRPSLATSDPGRLVRPVKESPSFPGSAWERTAREAPPASALERTALEQRGGASPAVRSQAEPGNEGPQKLAFGGRCVRADFHGHGASTDQACLTSAHTLARGCRCA